MKATRLHPILVAFALDPPDFIGNFDGGGQQ